METVVAAAVVVVVAIVKEVLAVFGDRIPNSIKNSIDRFLLV